jgi:hypothetical protein
VSDIKETEVTTEAAAPAEQAAGTEQRDVSSVRSG